jgi:hypothetical protein
LTKIAGILEQAENNKWLSRETSGRIFRSMTDMIGYDITEEDEAARIEKEGQR